MFDIDIDVASHTKKDEFGTRAIIYVPEKKDIKPHPSGYYIKDGMPVDGKTGMAAMDYKDAEAAGFIKVDLLTNTSYNTFESKEEVLEAVFTEPDWELLLDSEFVKTLPQLANHTEVVEEVAPKSIMELADTLALIRPGKRHLLEKYIQDKEKVRPNIYRQPINGGYYYKKSHAVATAHQIVAIMNKKDVRNLVVF